jgi:antitoxin HicB
MLFWGTVISGRQHKAAMAARMKTSRQQPDPLLDPDNPSVTLATLQHAANAVGRTLRVELE